MATSVPDPFESHLRRFADALADARERSDTKAAGDLAAQADRVFYREYGTLARHLERLDAPTVMSLLHPTTRAQAYVTIMALWASAADDVGDRGRATRLAVRALELWAALAVRHPAVLSELVLQRAFAAIRSDLVPAQWRSLWRDCGARVATQTPGYRRAL